ncbi:hypothetical protein AUJ46_03365 [Candidatus Peregrinibacteria bacterium CG1_02_54_53]|nr:MAG: hypothetical protein AUJ46_03365 [Candidatus Peregrinibacteria bacterium CG1_02_54_53]
MTRHSLFIGLISILLVAGLGAAVYVSKNPERFTATNVNLLIKQEEQNSILTPCSRFAEGYAYAQLPFRDGNFSAWPAEYHRIVGTVVDEHLQSFMRPPNCSALTGDGVLPGGAQLSALAKMLPSWKSASVSQWEAGSVLLEFLRAYECALEERLYFLHPDALLELEMKMQEREDDSDIYLSLLNTEVSEEDQTITTELATARPSLNRTLSVLAGLSRLLPLHSELQCIERSSLDIRNALALAAETSACLPRIWNAKDPLRDLPQ